MVAFNEEVLNGKLHFYEAFMKLNLIVRTRNKR